MNPILAERLAALAQAMDRADEAMQEAVRLAPTDAAPAVLATFREVRDTSIMATRMAQEAADAQARRGR